MKKINKAQEKENLFLREKPISKSIKSWNEDDRPREKLLMKGKRSLSDAELLAIILGSGSREESAVDLAKRILQSVNYQWQSLAKLSIEQLCTFKGIGEAKALNIIACLEIGTRNLAQIPLKKIHYSSAEGVYTQMQSILESLNHEEFWVIYLDRANREIKKEQISKGGISSTQVDIRIIMKQAIECQSSSIILVHNHPSGNLDPSESDKKLTQNIKEAAKIMQINLLDHIIIGNKDFFSFNEQHLL